ncbi:MAG: sugar phosphate nucleotidyltransferase [Actinomycetota bacterium]
MQAVVLVGGFGTRLRPLTLRIPKQLLPIAHVPMIERVVSHLADSGVTEVVLSLGYSPGTFIDRYPAGVCAGLPVHYAVEPEPLDTAGAIAFAARSAGIDSTFVAVNGDVLTNLDLGSVWDTHRANDAVATIALTPVEDPSRFGVVPLHPDGRVEAFIEKPPPGTAPSNWINAGTYVLEPAVLDHIEAGRRVSIEREVFPELVAQGSVYGVPSESYWVDAGTPAAYLQVHADVIAGRLGLADAPVSDSAVIDATAKVDRSFVGAGTVIGPGALVVGSVLMDGVRIGAGATVDGSIVAADSVVGDSSVVSGGTVIGYGEKLAAGTNTHDGRHPPPETWEDA